MTGRTCMPMWPQSTFRASLRDTWEAPWEATGRAYPFPVVWGLGVGKPHPHGFSNVPCALVKTSAASRLGSTSTAGTPQWQQPGSNNQDDATANVERPHQTTPSGATLRRRAVWTRREKSQLALRKRYRNGEGRQGGCRKACAQRPGVNLKGCSCAGGVEVQPCTPAKRCNTRAPPVGAQPDTCSVCLTFVGVVHVVPVLLGPLEQPGVAGQLIQMPGSLP